MSKLFKFIKEYYLMDLYIEEDLDIFVTAEYITSEEKEDILKSKKAKDTEVV